MTEWEQYCMSQARAWCERVKQSSLHLITLESAIEGLRARYDGLGAMRYDKQGGGGTSSPDDQLAAMVDELDALRGELVTSVAAYRDELAAFERALRRLDGLSDAILTARYVRAKRWGEIAHTLHYSEGYVRVLHTQALVELYEVMPESMKAIPKATE